MNHLDGAIELFDKNKTPRQPMRIINGHREKCFVWSIKTYPPLEKREKKELLTKVFRHRGAKRLLIWQFKYQSVQKVRKNEGRKIEQQLEQQDCVGFKSQNLYHLKISIRNDQPEFKQNSLMSSENAESSIAMSQSMRNYYGLVFLITPTKTPWEKIS